MSVSSLAVEKDIDPKSQEDHYVHKVYNEIASHFSQTRYKPWPIVEKFLKSRQDHSVGLDVGCGNGKYIGVNKKILMIGTDRSDGLINCAKENSRNEFNLGVADGLHLPHPADYFDFAISIAVIHHFATRERRVEAISHILSKIRKGGEVLIYCWALEQEKSRRGYKEGDEQDILIPWVLQKKQEKKTKERKGRRNNQTDEGQAMEAYTGTDSEITSKKDISVPPETKYRYYHLYKAGELVEDAINTNACTLMEDGYEKDNWWVILKKK